MDRNLLRDSAKGCSEEPSEVNVFGRRIQDERKRLRLTQRQLAAALGVSRITLGKYEAGRTPPELFTLARGARAVGLDLGYIATGARTSEVETESDWSLIGRLIALLTKHLVVVGGRELTPTQEAEFVRDVYMTLKAGRSKQASASISGPTSAA
jgi:transcriptional regulator with XRE-family HTH domain